MSEPGGEAVAPDPEHLAAVERWHAGRLQRLRAPDGWLSLVDRFPLDPGPNQLPIGTATLTGQVVHFVAAPGVLVTAEDGPVHERILRSDQGGPPDRLESGGRRYELIRRGDAFAIRVKDPRAPGLLAFAADPAGIPRYPVDGSYRVTASFERHQPARSVRMSFEMGEGDPRTVPGVARFTLQGKELALEPILEPDGKRLFFVFGDLTNRGQTYPGGRFLYADLPSGAPGAEAVVLDFNLAFNPPCALTEFAACPAIPGGNRLPVAVRAGERYQAPPG